MKKLEEYKSVGEWFLDARKEGYFLPLEMCREIQTTEKETAFSFKEIYNLFLEYNVIFIVGNSYVYDLKGRFKIKNYEKLKNKQKTK